MSTLSPDEPEKVAKPKKANKNGFFTIEARPFDWGELMFLEQLVKEFKSDQAWIDVKKTMAGAANLTVYTDTIDRAAFIDYLLNLPENSKKFAGRREQLDKMEEQAKKVAEGYSRDEEVIKVAPRRRKNY